jgi:hypothetical protein
MHTMHACTNGPPKHIRVYRRRSDSHSRTGFQTPENGARATAPRPIEQVSCSRPVHAGSTRSISRFRSQPSRIRMARAKTRSFSSGARREDGPGGQARARPVHGHMRTTRLLPFLHAPPPRWILLTSGPAAATGYTHVALLVSIAEVNSRSRTVLRLSARRQLNNACTREE